MGKPNKGLEEMLSETEIKMAVEAAAYEDAAWLDALAEDVNKKADKSKIDKEWSEFKQWVKKTLSEQEGSSIPSQTLHR